MSEYLETELEIIEGCIRGHDKARKTLYELYKGKLMGICSRYSNSREQAQDMLHETFIAIFTSIHNYKGTGTFEGWMSRVAVNTAVKYGKQWDYRKSSDILEHMSIQDLGLSPLQTLSHLELLQLVQKLPTGYRTIFNMYVVDGFSHDEISKQLNISTGTSKSQLSRAKETLARWLKLLDTSHSLSLEKH